MSNAKNLTNFTPIDSPATPLAATMTGVRLPQHIHDKVANGFASGYEKSAWLREVIEAAAIARWPELAAVAVAKPEPELNVEKEVRTNSPNNYELLYDRFLEAGNTEAIAKKGALFVLKAGGNYEPIEEILSRFAQKHHQFIVGVVESEQWRQQQEEKRADEIADNYQEKVVENFEALESYCDSPMMGSPKQQKWAKTIRSFAVENWLAPSVASGDMKYEEAIATLKNPDCKYWIENRKDWGCR